MRDQKSSKLIPPSFGRFLLLKIYGKDMFDEIEGDFLEIFHERVSEEGVFWAKVKYLRDAVLSIRNIDIKQQSKQTTNNLIMVKNYFEIAWRVLLKYPATSAINILGLAVGMGIGLLIYQYIEFELSYDSFHTKQNQIHRLIATEYRYTEHLGTGITHSYGLGRHAKEDIPEILDMVRIHPQYGGAVVTNTLNNVKFNEPQQAMYFVDQGLLDVFDFNLIQGDAKSMLSGKYNVVITERAAQKYFGTTDPIGKILKVDGGAADGEFQVTAVLENLPANSHLQFDILMPLETLLAGDHYIDDSGWDWNNFSTYILLDEKAEPITVSNKMNQLVTTYRGTELEASGMSIEIGLQALSDIHLRSNYSDDFASYNGDIENVGLFIFISIIILLTAWANYINLSTARAMQRIKEVGVRKSIGATKNQLIIQFLVEAFLVNVLAAILAIAIAYNSLPFLSAIIGRSLEMTVLSSGVFWLGVTLVLVFGSLLSGLYPAFVLSSYHPANMLRSVKMKTRKLDLRKGLILFQFVASVILIASTYIVYRQISYMKNQELGIKMNQMLVIRGPQVVDLDDEALKAKFNTFKTQLTNHHAIDAVAGSGNIPGRGYNWNGAIRKVGTPESAYKSGQVVWVGAEFDETYGLEFLAGEGFDPTMTGFRDGVIINEQAVYAYGLGSPEEAINQKLYVSVGDTVRVHGVTKNFHWSSLKDNHEPFLFVPAVFFNRYFSIRLETADLTESLAYIERTFETSFPNDPFEYYFLDDEFNRQYQADLQFGNLFSAFAVLAIFISCLGLFGLVSFSTTARIKEIGIRKTLGAEIPQLMFLLSKEYVMLLALAFLIGLPLVYLWSSSWLDNYAYKIGVSIDLFLVPMVMLALISMLTVSYKTLSAARSNPVNSLKVE